MGHCFGALHDFGARHRAPFYSPTPASAHLLIRRAFRVFIG